MRISDWSSDVCSSDLVPLCSHTPTPEALPGSAGCWLLRLIRGFGCRWECQELQEVAGRRSRLLLRLGGSPRGRELGSASCRERGGQSVELWVVVDSLRTTIK